MRIIPKIIFLVHLFLLPLVNSAKFGEPCNKANLCSLEGFLQCVSNVCQCVKPESLVYDEAKGVCIALPECDRNSHCGEEGVCVCNEDYFFSNRSCIPNKVFGEACTVDEEGNHMCRPDKYLECVDNKCGCDEAHSLYDEDRMECVAREGSSCVGYANCVPNAACPFRHTGSYYSSTLCTCQQGFSRSPEGLCLAIFGEMCNTKDKRCGHDMMCKNGRCECKFAERQKYDRDLNRCVSFVESPCLIKSKSEEGVKSNISFPCVNNAECKQNDNLYECRCKEGYIEGDHSCDLEYDQPCGEGIEDHCDRLAPLECINGKCKCSSEYLYYETNSRKCKALVGSPCVLGSKDFCTGGSECKETRNAISKYGLCRCTQGYLTTGGRKCIHHLLIRKTV
ncbi:Teneurin-m [Orchesella cincta]|uniref:Teneurin-m n=1 Tax=Orchesella cincta TaxID=48709 RepID=A0A1D2MU27_ORCCI|nr:Teneurin-m [Orchesella cincta]